MVSESGVGKASLRISLPVTGSNRFSVHEAVASCSVDDRRIWAKADASSVFIFGLKID